MIKKKEYFLLSIVIIAGLLVIPLLVTDAYAIPVKFDNQRGGENWILDNGQRMFIGDSGIAAPWVFNNATIYPDGDNTWVSFDFDDQGDGDYDILSGRIGTRFLNDTIKHYDTDTGLDVAFEKLHLFKNSGSTEIPLTFVSRTHQINTQDQIYDVDGFTINDPIDVITITENWTSSEANVVIKYLFVEGQPLKHTFTVTRTAAGTDTYQLYHEFDLVTDELELEANADSNFEKIKIKTGEIEFNESTTTTRTFDKDTFGDILQVMEFKTTTNKLILGEIVAPDTNDPAWDMFKELFIDATGDPKFFFRYGDWTISQFQSFELDPDTYSGVAPSYDAGVRAGFSTNSVCDNGSYTISDNANDFIGISKQRSDVSGECEVGVAKWDITSIPDGSDVTDTDFQARTLSSLNDRNCDLTPIDTDPDGASGEVIWDDVLDGTDYVSSVSTCNINGTWSRDLGTAADTDVENHLVTENWFAVGVHHTSMSREGLFPISANICNNTHASCPNLLRLTVVYTPPADYNIDLLDVYESSSTTLGSGTAICLDVDTDTAQTCGTALNAGSTYRFEIEVDNTSGAAGSPNRVEMQNSIGVGDVLGSIPVGNILNSGCSTNTNWVESIVSSVTARAASGTTCSISGGGTVEYWFVVTLDTDADNGLMTYLIRDADAITDTSAAITFTVNTIPNYNIDLLDVYESSSTTLDSGTSVCLNVDTDTAQSCGTNLVAGTTYRFEIEVDNNGEQAGSPTSAELRDMVAVNDVFGTILAGDILNSGCSTNVNWVESVVTNDAIITSGTTCSIAAAGTVEYWAVISLDPDANDGTGTFHITDGTNLDTSAVITFTVDQAAVYNIDLLDVYESSSTTLDSGTSVCLDVDTDLPNTCATALKAGTTYRFEIEVDNTGEQAGSPTSAEFRDVVAAADVLGTILAGDMLNSGCSTNTDWVESVVTDDAVITSGTTCSIAAASNAEFWFIITLDQDADDGLGTFFIQDAIGSDTSAAITFTVDTIPVYVVDLLDVYESSSTTLDSGTSVCLDVDLESASPCGTSLKQSTTYRFEIEVDNTGEQAGSPTQLDFISSVGVNDVLGSILVGDILNSGCSTNTDWVESIEGGTDARASSGTTCSIAAAGNAEYWFVITLDNDGDDSTATFSITDGTISDSSTTTTFSYLNLIYTVESLDVYQSNTRALDDGTAICLGVNQTLASVCNTDLLEGQTYQFQFNVTNTGGQVGNPTQLQFRDVAADTQILGSLDVSVIDVGCDDDGTDRVWTESINIDDVIGDSGTTCEIDVGGFEIYYIIATIDTDGDDNTAAFFLTDGTLDDLSTLTTFTVLNAPEGTVSVTLAVVGDTVKVTPRISITQAEPNDALIETIRYYQNGTLRQTTNINSLLIQVGETEVFSINQVVGWIRIPDLQNYNYTARFELNGSNFTNTIITGAGNITTREFDPAYFIANEPSQGSVNYTVSRINDNDGVNLRVNRDNILSPFSVECIFQTNAQANQNPLIVTETTPLTGTWLNQTGIGYYDETISGVPSTHVYGTCFNDHELFTFTSYTNSSLALLGISVFDDTFGTFLGVPVGIFFLVMLASMATQRTAPTFIIILLAMAGVMTTVGFFTLDSELWALMLIAGALGILVGRKFF